MQKILRAVCLSDTRGDKPEAIIRDVTYRNPGVWGEKGCLEQKPEC